MANWAKWIRENEPQAVGKPVAKRDERSIHFANGDGTTTAFFSGIPCHYQDSGEWAEIDTELRDVGGGVLAGLGTPAQVDVDGATRRRDTSYRQRPARLVRYRPSAVAVRSLATVPTNGSASGEDYVRSGPFWTYTVRLYEAGVSQELLLSEAPPQAPGTLPDDYICVEEQVEGLDLPDGEITGEFENEGMRFPDPTAEDANGDSPVTRRWALKNGEAQYVYTGVPAGWLRNAAYPVRVDPEFVSGDADCSVIGQEATYASARTTGSSGATSTWFSVGQYFSGSLYYVYRGLLLFDTSSIGGDSSVTQVNLKLTVYTDQSTADFDAQIVKCDWSAYNPPTGVNLDPAYDLCLSSSLDDNIWRNTAGISTSTPYTSGNLDATWVEKEDYTFYGMRSSRDSSATEPSGYERILICSSSYATEAYRPYLIVAYGASGLAISVTPGSAYRVPVIKVV